MTVRRGLRDLGCTPLSSPGLTRNRWTGAPQRECRQGPELLVDSMVSFEHATCDRAFRTKSSLETRPAAFFPKGSDTGAHVAGKFLVGKLWLSQSVHVGKMCTYLDLQGGLPIHDIVVVCGTVGEDVGDFGSG